MAANRYGVYERNNIAVKEAYRSLSVNILFNGYKEELKTLTITSCNRGDGKTTTSVNLAIALSQTRKKVLLIDADLRKPSLIKRLGCNSEKGLSSLILGHATLEEVINTTSVQDFDFIGCGPVPANPIEILGSNRFTELLKEFRQKYDIIIFDTSPLGSVIDSAIIASQTDGTILVFKSESVALYKAQLAKEQLEKAGAHLLGAVLNRIQKNEYRNLYNYCYQRNEKSNIKSNMKRNIKSYKGNFG